jgi:hypothetical protein
VIRIVQIIPNPKVQPMQGNHFNQTLTEYVSFECVTNVNPIQMQQRKVIRKKKKKKKQAIRTENDNQNPDSETRRIQCVAISRWFQ